MNISEPSCLDFGNFALSPGIIHVWEAITTEAPGRIAEYYEILSQSEYERANRFHFEQHRFRFIICRAWLRVLLSAYTGQPAAGIELITNEFGKPSLKDQAPNRGLVFNVSHSAERLVFAFGRDCMLGVDIELMRNMTHLEGLCERICCEAEIAYWRKLPVEKRLETFFRIWVHKEAILKAHGQGLSLSMRECQLTHSLERPSSLPESCGTALEWSLIELNYFDGYQGAIAVNQPCATVIRRALPKANPVFIIKARLE